jgi:hypothetical protein
MQEQLTALQREVRANKQTSTASKTAGADSSLSWEFELEEAFSNFADAVAIHGNVHRLRSVLRRAALDKAFVLRILVIGNSVTLGAWCEKSEEENKDYGPYTFNSSMANMGQIIQRPADMKDGDAADCGWRPCAYPCLLAKMLPALLPHGNFKIMNVARHGWGSKQWADGLQGVLQNPCCGHPPIERPHIVMLDFGTSDPLETMGGTTDSQWKAYRDIAYVHAARMEELYEHILSYKWPKSSPADLPPAIIDIEMPTEKTSLEVANPKHFKAFRTQRAHSLAAAWLRMPTLSLESLFEGPALPILLRTRPGLKSAFSLDYRHPSWLVHQLMAQVSASFLKNEIKAAKAFDPMATRAATHHRTETNTLWEHCTKTHKSTSPDDPCLGRIEVKTELKGSKFNWFLINQNNWQKNTQFGLVENQRCDKTLATCVCRASPSSDWVKTSSFKCAADNRSKRGVYPLHCEAATKNSQNAGSKCPRPGDPQRACVPAANTGWFLLADVPSNDGATTGWITCGNDPTDPIRFVNMTASCSSSAMIKLEYLQSYAPYMGSIKAEVRNAITGQVLQSGIISGLDTTRRISVPALHIIAFPAANVKELNVLITPIAQKAENSDWPCPNKFKILSVSSGCLPGA